MLYCIEIVHHTLLTVSPASYLELSRQLSERLDVYFSNMNVLPLDFTEKSVLTKCKNICKSSLIYTREFWLNGWISVVNTEGKIKIVIVL